jgi:hypothetical protein
MAHDIVHYPDVERVGYIEGETWRLHRTDDGSLIMEGKNRAGPSSYVVGV